MKYNNLFILSDTQNSHLGFGEYLRVASFLPNIKFKKRKVDFLPVIGKGITFLIWFRRAIQIPRHVRSTRPTPTRAPVRRTTRALTRVPA